MTRMTKPMKVILPLPDDFLRMLSVGVTGEGPLLPFRNFERSGDGHNSGITYRLEGKSLVLRLSVDIEYDEREEVRP